MERRKCKVCGYPLPHKGIWSAGNLAKALREHGAKIPLSANSFHIEGEKISFLCLKRIGKDIRENRVVKASFIEEYHEIKLPRIFRDVSLTIC